MVFFLSYNVQLEAVFMFELYRHLPAKLAQNSKLRCANNLHINHTVTCHIYLLRGVLDQNSEWPSPFKVKVKMRRHSFFQIRLSRIIASCKSMGSIKVWICTCTQQLAIAAVVQKCCYLTHTITIVQEYRYIFKLIVIFL